MLMGTQDVVVCGGVGLSTSSFARIPSLRPAEASPGEVMGWIGGARPKLRAALRRFRHSGGRGCTSALSENQVAGGVEWEQTNALG
jgi:hypothetical protein